ncbi:hypothetical protein RRG08_033897 [Elysia crispata]|uniref:Uncharacterized protein n=1 Tax=Elysia crispata TaxID=231223 RepID=A0AAE1B8L4_9GAST|nr:hypothetical protein RRG08_033897 [Elysia crispata]
MQFQMKEERKSWKKPQDIHVSVEAHPPEQQTIRSSGLSYCSEAGCCQASHVMLGALSRLVTIKPLYFQDSETLYPTPMQPLLALTASIAISFKF